MNVSFVIRDVELFMMVDVGTASLSSEEINLFHNEY